jgi:hypothetical protein
MQHYITSSMFEYQSEGINILQVDAVHIASVVLSGPRVVSHGHCRLQCTDY